VIDVRGLAALHVNALLTRAARVLVRLVSLFLPRLRMFLADLGQRREVDTSKARKLRGFAPRPADRTILDCTESLLTLRGSWVVNP
jgi:hypothetical protein